MKQFIKCPNCGSIELATVDHSTAPFSTWMHFCNQCEYAIQESDWAPIPALSIRQPWAWLIVNGYKDIENRNNLKNFTGDFLIHASVTPDWEGYYSHLYRNSMKDIVPTGIECGGIIGHAKITGFVEQSESPWFVGKYGLLIKDAKPLPFTPCKGKLSFFKPEIE
ncbi:hypothetical protein [Mangrovibacterium sp.]|uniref:hypothetical protein n=1 Tax=Mangrovibacterium sp. TaxID=1961364 RepID=UPI00356A67D9